MSSRLRAQFHYEVDRRGHRTQATETIATPSMITATYDKDAMQVTYDGTWTDAGDFKRTTRKSATMRVDCAGDEGLLVIGTGPDHGIFDVYIGGSLWQSYDAYAPEAGERAVLLPLTDAFEIRNTSSKRLSSTGHVLRFKQLGVMTVSQTERTLQYTYDALSRLIVADDGTSPVTYGYDLAGNLVNVDGTTRTYNAANQMTHDGTNTLTYDPNGNLTSDGTNTYTWDRANRLLSMGGVSYVYNGDGNRIQQNALEYILDLQPALAQVIGDSDGKRYIHAPRGIHAQHSGTDWQYPIADGLGSVRGYVAPDSTLLSSVNYSELGVPDTAWEGWAFTGEMRSNNGTQYHRARHLAPSLGIWASLDPFEGLVERPMSLNEYAWVEGNVTNATDASGKLPCEYPKGSGNFDRNCVAQILGKLQTDANNAELLGIFAPSSGATVASRLLWHYLSNQGTTYNVKYDWFDPSIYNKVQKELRYLLEETKILQDICVAGCCPENTLEVDLLTPNTPIRGDSYFGIEPAWWSQLPKLISENDGSVRRMLQPAINFYRNPYYLAFGGITVNSISPSSISIKPRSWGGGEIDMNTSIEHFDYYDWCFGSDICRASGTHPQGYRVGHFMTLEEVGRGKPFNLYSYAKYVAKIGVICVGKTPIITGYRWSIEDLQPVPTDRIHPPINQPIGRSTPRFVDNWPDDPGFPLFPTEDILPP